MYSSHMLLKTFLFSKKERKCYHKYATDMKKTKLKKHGYFMFTVFFLNGQKILPLRFKKAGRFEKLLCFARSHFIVTCGSVSLSCATTPHPSYFSKS